MNASIHSFIHSFILHDLHSSPVPHNSKALDMDFVSSYRSSTCSLPLNKLGPVAGREATPRLQRTREVDGLLTSTLTIVHLEERKGLSKASTTSFSEASQKLTKGVAPEVHAPALRCRRPTVEMWRPLKWGWAIRHLILISSSFPHFFSLTYFFQRSSDSPLPNKTVPPGSRSDCPWRQIYLISKKLKSQGLSLAQAPVKPWRWFFFFNLLFLKKVSKTETHKPLRSLVASYPCWWSRVYEWLVYLLFHSDFSPVIPV